MANFKITNITNTAGKRSARFNSILDIEYDDAMQKKTIKVKPGETVFLQIHTLPLSVHKLRVKKLISVSEISNNELRNSMNVGRPAVIPVVIETPEETEMEKRNKKKVSKKTHESEPVEN